MPGYIPPPTPPSKIGWDGQSKLTIPKAGLSLVAGIGLLPTTTPDGKLQLDTALIDAPERFALFTPGLLVAGTVLGKWSNVRASGRAVALALEANLGTAPGAGVNGTNYLAVKAADALGNFLQLPLDGSGDNTGRHYTLNKASGGVIAAPAQDNTNSSFSDSGKQGVAQFFTPTQNLSVNGVAYRLGYSGSDNTARAGSLRCTLLDTSDYLNPLAVVTTATQATAPSNAGGLNHFEFTRAIQLLSGHSYVLCFDFFLANPAGTGPGGTDLGTYLRTGGTGQSAPITVGTGYVFEANGNPGIVNQTWGAAFAGGLGSRTIAGGYTFASGAGGVWTSGQYCALLGSGGQTILTGDVTVSLVSVGAPTAANVGNDLNVGVLLNT